MLPLTVLLAHLNRASVFLFLFWLVRHRPPQGKLRVIIVEGVRLAARDPKGISGHTGVCFVLMTSLEPACIPFLAPFGLLSQTFALVYLLVWTINFERLADDLIGRQVKAILTARCPSAARNIEPR